MSLIIYVVLKIKTYRRFCEILGVWIQQTKLNQMKLVLKYTPAHFFDENSLSDKFNSSRNLGLLVNHNGSIL